VLWLICIAERDARRERNVPAGTPAPATASRDGVDTCIDCGAPLEGPALDARHPECFAERVPRDAAHLVLGGLVQLLGPLLAVWGA
jgi:hypothetical protein